MPSCLNAAAAAGKHLCAAQRQLLRVVQHRHQVAALNQLLVVTHVHNNSNAMGSSGVVVLLAVVLERIVVEPPTEATMPFRRISSAELVSRISP